MKLMLVRPLLVILVSMATLAGCEQRTCDGIAGSVLHASATPDPAGHRVLYQEGVDAKVRKNGKELTTRIVVYGIAGLPFPSTRLEVDRRAVLSATIIDIDRVENGAMIPKSDSAVPVNMGFGEDNEFRASFFTHAVNVTWRFMNADTRFQSAGDTYIVEKIGATVAFTKAGVRFDGVRKATGCPGT